VSINFQEQDVYLSNEKVCINITSYYSHYYFQSSYDYNVVTYFYVVEILIKKGRIMNAPENLALDTQTITVPFTSNTDDDLVGSVVTFFKVQPTQSCEDWVTELVNTSTATTSLAPSLLFQFESIDIPSGIQKELIDEPPASQLRVQTEIKYQGQRLVITVDNVDNNLEFTELAFRYIASCIDTSKGAGELKVFYSQDPTIGIRRRKEN